METRVRFLEDCQKSLTVLEIQAPLRHPLTEDIERRLRRLGVQVVHSESRMARSGTRLTLQVAEASGAPLSQRRRLEVQTFLLSRASPSDTPPPGATFAGRAVHGSNKHGSDIHGGDIHGSDAHRRDVHGSDVHGRDVHGRDTVDRESWPG